MFRVIILVYNLVYCYEHFVWTIWSMGHFFETTVYQAMTSKMSCNIYIALPFWLLCLYKSFYYYLCRLDSRALKYTWNCLRILENFPFLYIPPLDIMAKNTQNIVIPTAWKGFEILKTIRFTIINVN